MGRARAPGGGRKPTPTAIKRLNGNPGRRPFNKKEARPARVVPECPAVIQGEARAQWDRTVERLSRAGLLTEIDGDALTLYCLAWERFVEAQQKLREHGSVIVSPNGYLLQSPYLAIANKATEQMMRIGVEFGMTPSSRSRVQAATPLPPPGSSAAVDGEEDRGEQWLREYGFIS